jgi:hypothetical protein
LVVARHIALNAERSVDTMHCADLIDNRSNSGFSKVRYDNTYALISQQVGGGSTHSACSAGDNGHSVAQGTRQLGQARHGRIS